MSMSIKVAMYPKCTNAMLFTYYLHFHIKHMISLATEWAPNALAPQNIWTTNGGNQTNVAEHHWCHKYDHFHNNGETKPLKFMLQSDLISYWFSASDETWIH